MSSRVRTAGPKWKRNAIHAAVVVALSQVVFAAPAGATQLCQREPVNSISTALTETQCPDASADVTVTSAGSVSVGDRDYSIGFLYIDGLVGSLTNQGTISAAASSSYAVTAYGVKVGALRGTLNNSGTISAMAGSGSVAEAYAIKVGTLGTLNNSGMISAVAGPARDAKAYGIDVDTLSGTLNNSGTISAAAAARGPNSTAYGVNVSDLDGSLDNSGMISAVAGLANDVEAYAIKVGTLSGTLNNSGTISAEAGRANNPGAYGVSLETLSGTLNNSGQISAAAADGDAYAVRITGFAGGTLNNSGRIAASSSFRISGPDGDGFYVSNGDNYSLWVGKGSGGTINNLAGGYLVGNLYVERGVDVNNAGTIAIDGGEGVMIDGGEGSDGGEGGMKGFVRGFVRSSGYIADNYTQLAGGKVDLIAQNAKSYGSLEVGGTADFTASQLLAIHAKADNNLEVGDVLTDVVSADNLLGIEAGTVVKVVGTPLFTFSGVGNSDNGINVRVVSKNNFKGVLGGSLAATLDELVAGYGNNDGAFDPMLDALYGQDSREGLVDATRKLAPSLADGLNRSSLGVIGDVGRIIGARQGANRGLSSGDTFFGDRQFWFKPFGSYARQGEHSDVLGYSADSYGLVFGADGEVSETTRLGGAFAYVNSDVSSRSSTVHQSGETDTFQLTAYGSHALDAQTNLSFQGGLARHQSDSQRVIDISGLWLLPTATAKGSYNGWSANLGAALERDYAINPQTIFTPSVRADYVRLYSQGYSESGAGALNLKVKSNTADSLVLGVDGKLTYALTDTAKLTANLGLGYDALAGRDSVTASFAGGGAAFSTKGIDASPWVIRGGLGYVVTNSKAMEMSVRYDLEARPSSYTNQTASLNIRMPF